MPSPIKKHKDYAVGVKAIDRTIERLVRMTDELDHRDLIKQLLTTIVKMGSEDFSRGDLKIINTTLKELRYAFGVFEPYRHVRKAAVFGSARTPETAPAFKSAREFGKYIAAEGWMVITGGSTGIMRAGLEGAGRTRSFGLNIRLPFEQAANTVIEGDKKLINFKYFFTRKLSFIKESDATVLYPGGFGTHDEGMESLTLVQTGKNYPRPVVLVDTPGDSYWKPWLSFVKKSLLANKMIDPEDFYLFTLVTSPKKACEVVCNFYKIYHSLRYVGDQTVIRLSKEIPDARLKKLNQKFASLVVKGKIEHCDPLSAEADEPEIASLPRLKLSYNRRSYGKLKLFIDDLNLS